MPEQAAGGSAPRRRGGRGAGLAAGWLLIAIVILLRLAAGIAPPPQFPQGAEALAELLRGVALMGQFDPAGAELAFLRSNALEPSSAARLNRAIAVLNQTGEGDQERAVALLQEVLRAAPGDVRAGYARSLGLLFLGRPEEAMAGFRTAAAADPQDAWAAFYLGQALEMAGRVKEAEPHYRRATQLEPLLRSPWLGLQRCAARQERAAEGDAALQVFLELAENPRARLAEFKYTRMGQLGLVVAPQGGAGEAVVRGGMAPVGAPFSEPPLERAAPAGGMAALVPVAAGRLGAAAAVFAGAGIGGASACVMVRGSGGGFSEVRDHPLLALPGAAEAVSAWFGDLNDDGRCDAFLAAGAGMLAMQGADGRWRDATAASGMTAPPAPTAPEGAAAVVDAVLADLDHDGDLDLAVAWSAGAPAIFMNRGDGTFQAMGAASGFAPAGACRGVQVADLDMDGMADLILCTGDGAEVWLGRPLWRWERQPRWRGVEALPAIAAVAFAHPADGAPALAMLLEGRPANGAARSLALVRCGSGRHPRAGAVEVTEVPLPEMPGAGWVAALDVDGSGRTAILVASAQRLEIRDADDGRLRWSVDHGPWGVPAVVTEDAPRGPLLLAAGALGGSVAELSPAPGRRPFLTVDFRGRTDPSQSMRSNADGVGTRWLARQRGGWSQGTTFRTHSGPGQGLQPTAIGVGDGHWIEFLSLDWSDGVLQTEARLQPSAAVKTIVETQRQISSCPLIFAWDGGGFLFETDCLGVGGLGYLAGIDVDADGRLRPVYAPPRPRESVKLRTPLAERDGTFELRLGEPMEEACYLDAAALDEWWIPPGWHLCLDERMSLGGPEPSGEARFWRRSQALSAAEITDAAGSRDARAALLEADGAALPPGPVDPRFIGRLASATQLTLEFPEPIDAASGPALLPGLLPALLVDGWVEYPYSQTTFAMWQAGRLPQGPRLEAQDPASGEWRTLTEAYGYPAGMARESLFPLRGPGVAPLPAGCRRLRITTDLELYLDRVRLVQLEPCPDAQRHSCPLRTATLATAGYPQRLPAPQKRALFRYDERRPLWDCRTQPGRYTALGECTPLLAEDGALAIFGPGEELRLRFQSATGRQDLPQGFTRTWVLSLRGWCKDMDRYTGDGGQLEPLPRDPAAPPAPGAAALEARFNVRAAGGRE